MTNPILLMLQRQMNKAFVFSVFLILLLFTGFTSKAQVTQNSKSLDQIVAVVNDHIILKSEVNERVQQELYQMSQRNQNQNVSFSKDMWYATLQNIVNDFVLLDQAKIDSVTISDEQVDRRIDQRINQIVQQLGSEQALEERMGKSIVQIRADLRDQFRQDQIIQQYRVQKMQDVHITRPEVEAYFNKIPKDSLPTIPEQVALSQIVAISPPNEDARREAKKFAEQLRDSLINYDKNIEDLARKYSDGPSASNGGKIPMYPLDQLAPEYSAAAAALEPGEISEVVETSFGFHVIRLNKRQGDQIDTNHILIKVDEDSYNDQAAIDTLNAIRDSLLNHEDVKFADVAREKSEDPNTAPQGGRIYEPNTGSRTIPLEQLDPAMYRIALLLTDKGDISEPKPFTIGSGNNTKRAYRIVRLDEHVSEHTANLKDDYQQIKNSALQQKQYEMLSDWINKLKEDVYVEYKIPMPKQYTQVQS